MILFFIFLFIFLIPSVRAQSPNILKNGDFEKGILYWEAWSWGCSVNSIIETGQPVFCGDASERREFALIHNIAEFAPVKESQKSLKVIIQGAKQDQEWKSHLKTSGNQRDTLGIPKGKMIVEFWAKTSQPFISSVDLSDAFPPYNSLGLYKQFQVGSEWKHYSYTFNSDGSPSASLLFNFGNADDFTFFHLDEVKLYAAPDEPTDSLE